MKSNDNNSCIIGYAEIEACMLSAAFGSVTLLLSYGFTNNTIQVFVDLSIDRYLFLSYLCAV